MCVWDQYNGPRGMWFPWQPLFQKITTMAVIHMTQMGKGKFPKQTIPRMWYVCIRLVLCCIFVPLQSIRVRFVCLCLYIVHTVLIIYILRTLKIGMHAHTHTCMHARTHTPRAIEFVQMPFCCTVIINIVYSLKCTRYGCVLFGTVGNDTLVRQYDIMCLLWALVLFILCKYLWFPCFLFVDCASVVHW